MALSDLKQVSTRLKGLHRELEKKDGRKWPHYELAHEMGIRPRTFQSWENGEVENTNGKGYDKMARYYSRKLGRKITRQWIVFGDRAEEPQMTGEKQGPSLGELSEAVAGLQDRVRELAEEQTRLLARLAEEDAPQSKSRSTSKRPVRSRGEKRK